MRPACRRGLEFSLGRTLSEDEANIYTARLVERLRKMASAERDWWNSTSRVQHMRGAGDRMLREIPDAALSKVRAETDARIERLEELERQIAELQGATAPAEALPGLPRGASEFLPDPYMQRWDRPASSAGPFEDRSRTAPGEDGEARVLVSPVGRLEYRILSADTWRVDWVEVDAAGRNKKHGVALYEELIRLGRLAGAAVIESDTSVSGDARNVYGALKRRGYEITGGPPFRINLAAQLFQNDPLPGFYSALERFVSETKTRSATPAQWKATLLQAPGVKREELQWVGVLDWLDALGSEKVSREDVLAFVQENGVRVEETLLGEPVRTPEQDAQQREALDLIEESDRIERGLMANSPADIASATNDENVQRAFQAYQAAERAYDDALVAELNEEGVSNLEAAGDVSSAARQELARAARERSAALRSEASAMMNALTADETRWEDLTLRGGENYRELLLVLPTPISEAQEGIATAELKLNALLKRSHGFTERGARDFTLEAARDHLSTSQRQFVSDHAEVAALVTALREAYVARSTLYDAGERIWTHPHWRHANVFAHIRFNERVDTDGKRTLFVEEIQSDLHQSGRDHGYRDSELMKASAERVSALTLEMERMAQERDPVTNMMLEEKRWHQLARQRDEAREAYQRESKRAMDMPFKSNAWAKLAMRRVLRWAAENAFEQVAWTTGAQQVRRNSLAQRITVLDYKRLDDGSWQLQNQSPTVSSNNVARRIPPIPDERLEEYVGQDVAQRMREGAGERIGYHANNEAENWYNRLKGTDLEIGGEGMRAFYDRVLPNIANDLGKKYQARTGETTIPAAGGLDEFDILEVGTSGRWRVVRADNGNVVSGDRTFASGADAEKWLESEGALNQAVHAFPITPALAEAVMAGQPLFHTGKKRTGETVFRGSTEPKKTPDGSRYIGATVRLFEAANLSTFLHEGAHVMLLMLDDLANGPGATDAMLKLWSDTLDWMGITGSRWEDMTDEQRVPYHEMWARTFEAYLREGKAPTIGLRRVFQVVKGWLLDIYKVITLQHNLTPEIRSVFDRLIASEEEIAAARAAMGADRTFARELFDTEEAYQRYVQRYERAAEEAKDALAAAAMELHFRQEQAWWNRELGKQRRAAARALDVEPVRRAFDWLAYGKYRGETRRFSQRTGDEMEPRWGWIEAPEDLPSMVLDAAAVLEDYGPEVLESLPEALRPVAEEDIEQLMELAKRVRAAERARGPTRLTSWVIKQGGINDEGGDVLKIIGNYRARPGLINKKSGRSLDDMALAVWEAGFFPTKPEKGAHVFGQVDPVDQTDSPLFGRWFQQSQVVDDDGLPLVVYYSGEVLPVEFDPTLLTDGDYGRGFTFEASTKQANRVADLMPEGIRDAIDRRAKEIERESGVAALNVAGAEAMRERARRQAEAEFEVSDAAVAPVYLSLQNPVIIGGKNETVLELEGSNVIPFRANDEAAPAVGGALGEFFTALREIALAYRGDVAALHEVIEAIRAKAARNGNRITFAEIWAQFEKADRRAHRAWDKDPQRGRRPESGILSYRLNDRRSFRAWPEMVRAAFEELGFDGIIDHTARKVGRNGGFKKGQTTRYYPFRANQVKSAVGNVGTFDPRSGNILYQEEDGRPTPRQFLDLLEQDLRGDPVHRVEDEEEARQLEEDREWAAWFDQHGIDLSGDPASIRAQIEAFVRRETKPPNAAHPDEIAEVFGFESGDALLKALAEMQPRAEVIEEMAQRAMRAEYGDPFADGTIDLEARLKAHSALQSHVIELELETLERATGGLARPLAKAAKRFAEERVRRMRVRDVRNYDRFLKEEREHAQKALEAAERGDRTVAAFEKKAQLYAFHTYLAARDAARRIERAETTFKQLQRKASRARIGQALIDQIDQLLERFDLKPLPRSVSERIGFAAWYAEMEKQGLTRLLHVDSRLVTEERRRPWAQITVDEAFGLYETVENLAHLGRQRDDLLLARDRQKIEDVENAIVASIAENAPEARRRVRTFSATRGEKAMDFVEGLIAEQTKPEYIARLLDGGADNGAAWRNIFRVIAEAESNELEMGRLAGIRLREILSVFSDKEKAKLFSVRYEMTELGPDEDGVPRSMTKAEMMAVALNSGNAYGRDVLTEGYGWNEVQLLRIIDRLSKKEMDTVQAIWDWIDEYRKPRFDLHERVTGVRPERVEPLPLPTRHGIYRGGYYHIAYSSREDELQFAREQAAESMDQLFQSPYFMASTKQGALQQRRGSGGKKVRLDLGVLQEQITEAIHDITHREAIIDTWRLLNRPAIQQAIIKAVGRAHYRQLNTWLRAVAIGPRQEMLHVEKFAETMRRNFTRATFGFKLMSALIQPLGIMNAVPRTGALPLFQAVAKTYLTGKPHKEVAFVMERSAYMQSLFDVYDRDVKEAAANAGLGNDRIFPAGFDKAAFFLMGIMAVGTSVPIWRAAYEQARAGKVENIDPLDEAAAVAHADSAVRMTQGSGAIKDQSSIMGRRGLVRILTMFMSWASAFYNQIFFEQIPGVVSGRIPFHQFLWNMMWTWFLPATLMMWLYGGLERDDDETEEQFAARLAAQYAFYPFSGVILLNQVINGIASGFDYETTPLARLGADVTNVGQDVLRWDFDEGTFKSAFMAAGYATGLPAPQAWITLDYAHDVAAGTEVPEADPADAAREALLSNRRR